MNAISKKALKLALKNYSVSFVIAIFVSVIIFFTSGDLLASITVGLALALAGFRFVYLDYLKARA